MDFWTRAWITWITALAIFVGYTGYMVYVGESMPLSWVVDIQQSNVETVYRPRYGNRDQQFKILSINTRQPEVLAIGSSRILQFRRGFFNRQPEVFYNAAAPAWRLEQVLRVLTSINDDALPRVVILAIDPPWFNDAYIGDVFPPDETDYQHRITVNRGIARDLANGIPLGRNAVSARQYPYRRVPGTDDLALGMRAIRDGHGFRSDGSELYGDFLVAGWLSMQNTRDAHRALMRDGRDMYVYGDIVSDRAMNMMNTLLTWARERDITVVGYLPSYMPILWEEMMARGNHTYMQKMIPPLQALFSAYGFQLFDFSNGASVNTYEGEFFDGWHASELSNLRLYLQMVEAMPEVFEQYSDFATLQAITSAASSTWDVFGLDGIRR